MEFPEVERHMMMLKRFQIEHLKALLTTFGKSTTGNHQELIAVANQLIKEKENNPGFRNFFMTLHARIMQHDFAAAAEPELQVPTSQTSTSENVKNILQTLLAKPRFPIDRTIDLIRKRFEENEVRDADGVKSSIFVSVTCPLGKTRINIPCRGEHCKHLQCFDAETFLVVHENMKKRIFSCPNCENMIDPANLVVDEYFLQVLNTTPIRDENKVEIYSDFSWPVLENEEAILQEHSSDEDIVVVEEVQRRPAPTPRRKINSVPVNPDPIPAEDMLVVVEIND